MGQMGPIRGGASLPWEGGRQGPIGGRPTPPLVGSLVPHGGGREGAPPLGAINKGGGLPLSSSHLICFLSSPSYMGFPKFGAYA